VRQQGNRSLLFLGRGRCPSIFLVAFQTAENVWYLETGCAGSRLAANSLLLSILDLVLCLKKVMGENVAILKEVNSTNFAELHTLYTPKPGYSGFVTALTLRVNIKSIPAAEFPAIPNDTPVDAIEQMFEELEETLEFKQLKILLKKGSDPWVWWGELRVFNKHPYYQVDMMAYYTQANTIDLAEDLSLGLQLFPGHILAANDKITIFGTVIEEKKNNGNEELAQRIAALETLLGLFGAASATLPGSNGLVPAPPAGSAEYLLRGDRTWQNPTTFGFANTTDIATAVLGIIGGAPDTLDTLGKLALALANDPAFATTTATALGTKVTKTGNETLGGIKTFTSVPRIQGVAPGFWLDETDHTQKGGYLLVDGGVLQVQRRATNFGDFEAIVAMINLINGNVTLNSTTQATSLTSAALVIAGGCAIKGNIITSLPTSAAGLPVGALWRDINTIKVV